MDYLKGNVYAAIGKLTGAQPQVPNAHQADIQKPVRFVAHDAGGRGGGKASAYLLQTKYPYCYFPGNLNIKTTPAGTG